MSGTDRELTKNIKYVAIVGCGNVASDADDDPKKRHIYSHAKAISMIKRLKLTACCDIDESRLKVFAQRWGVHRKYIDLEKMLSKEQIDILVIATPTKTHYENVQAALSSNVKVLFCEKPFVFDFKSGVELVNRAKEADKLLIVNYMRRWDNFYTECKGILESGELGRIETIVAYVDTAFYMNSSHMLDMLIFFAGDVFSCVGCIDRVNDVRIVHGEKDFGGIALIKHKNGIVSFVKATGESRRNHFFEIDIQCTKGRLRILDDDMRYEVYNFRESPQHKGLDELMLAYTKINDDKHERLVEAYLEILGWIERREEPSFLAMDALKSIELINIIYQSDAAGNMPMYSKL